MIHIEFGKKVQQAPLKIAIEEAKRAITYHDLNKQSIILASILKKLGVKKDTIVGVVLPSGINLVTSILAVFRAGAIYLPVDIEFAPKRLADIFEQSPCEIIISCIDLDEDIISLVKNFSPETQHIILLGEDEPLVLQASDLEFKRAGSLVNLQIAPDEVLQPDDANYIFYTSGSTGKPKPILGCHKSLSHFITWEIDEFKLNEQIKVSQLTQFTFDASLRDIFVPLCAGGTLCIPPADVKFNFTRLIQWIEQSEITLIHTVPSLFRLITKELQQSETKEHFKSLQYFLLAGEPLFAKDIMNWRKQVGEHTEVVNLYGPSETTMVKTFHRIKEVPLSPSEGIHAGKPIANTFIAILNNNKQLCNIGEKGEIYICTPYKTKGYYRNDDLTNQVFIQNPLVTDFKDIVYKTGDFGRYLKDRSIEILGRIDDQIKINGIRIEPEEIRKSILDTWGVEEAYVTGYKNNDNLHEMVCYYTGLEKDDATFRKELVSELNENMIPSYFIRLEAFPLNSNGKINKKELPKPEDFLVNETDYEAVINETEQTLEEIWKEVLDVKRIGRKVSFFNLGGTSIKATQIVTRVFKAFNTQISIRAIFSYQSIAELAAFIDKSTKEDTTEIKAIPEAEFYPVSQGQKRLWILTQLESDTAVYNMSSVFILTGTLNIEALQNAFNKVIERHEILRTTFIIQNDEIKQCVHPAKEINFNLPYLDLRNDANGESKALEISATIALSYFDFERGPLLKANIIRVSENQYMLPFTMHHIISDGWSMEILIKELLLIYQSIVNETSLNLPGLKIQYKDYATWQTEQLQGIKLEQHKTYWLDKLGGSLPILELPYEGNRPVLKTFNGASSTYTFDKDLIKDFKTLCQQNGSSLHMGLLAVMYALFYRYSGQTDLILGSPSAGRIHQDLEDQIGFYVNLLPLRTVFEPTDSFIALLAKVKDTTLGAYEHQIYPFDRLVEDLQLAREMSRSPLFDVAVILHNTSIKEEQLDKFAGLSVERLEPETTLSKYDMQANFYEEGDVLTLNLEYNTDLFSSDRTTRMIQHMNQFMQSVTANAEESINMANILTSEERHALVYDWNNTITPYSQEKTIHQLFEEQVQLNPNGIAAEQNETHLTYRELNEQANQLARHLLEKGLQNGDNVGIMTDRNLNMLVGMLGILKAGGAYVPIDPVYPIDRQLYICENSAITLFVADHHYPVINKLPKKVPFIVISAVILASYSNYNLDFTTKSSQDLAYTIYTSGSTGRPKGVMIAHHSAVNLIEWVNKTYKVDKKDRLLFITSMCFDLSVYDIFGMLAAGGTVVIATQEEVRDVARLKRLMMDKEITFWDSVPTSMNHLIAGLEDDDSSYIQNSLRVVFMSGDWIPVDLPGRIKKHFPLTEVISLGGATEGTVWSNFYPVKEVKEGWTSIPYGKPLDNNFFYILDEWLNPVPQGIPGELFIGGVGVARGYANDPEKTAYSYINDPFNQLLGGMMYRTGDLGRMLPDWNMEFLGRKDHQIKIRGFRVEIGEVNTALVRNELIKEAIVVSKGEKNNKFLVAYFTSTVELKAEDLRIFLLESLPDYMIPSHLIQLEKLPLNANGKVDHKALPDPKDLNFVKGRTFKAPVTQTEIRLFEIWKQVLNIEQISITDVFFAIGGHSLNATRLLGRIHKEFGVRMELRNMFIYPTIETMAPIIESSLEKTFQEITQVKSQEYYELSHAQQRLWLVNQADKNDLAYNISTAYEINGDLDIDAFEKSFMTLIERHEVLRTTFVLFEGQPRQRISEPGMTGFKVEQFDISLLPNVEEEAQKLAEVEMPFDLEEGPLLRVKVIKLDAAKYLFLFSMHHIISDAWSMGVIINEVTQLYSAYSKNEPILLPQLAVQYKDYVYWHKNRLDEQHIEIHKNYWKDQFKGTLPVLSLETDFERPIVKTYNGSVHFHTIPDQIFSKIRELADRKGISSFMVLTAIVKTLLYRYTGQEDIIIGTPISGRDHYLLENQIGFYVNTLALRTVFNGNGTFNELLEDVKNTILGAFEHQFYPYDELVAMLQLERNKSRSPLFDVGIEYQNMVIEAEVKELNGITLQLFKTENKISKFDLSFRFFENDGQLTLGLVYNTDMFVTESIQLLCDRLMIVLTSVMENPDVRIEDIRLSGTEHTSLMTTNVISESFNFNF
ncbi:amino acid adenylation domain-containing protein [Chryseobacterium rhizoplanae]|uniref:Amino acid adenylation domain-containing protein n=1 Tax=Chryseobacterium rhizoplanae TaxID=1609531 RepID=A0A521EI01_9FLAO|nr:non-ribosomal peptide synthetase [Chryseobacterium rhizoplanae]SMO83525.1 amino acid adenylation domain-containing protein [Chryseobacterium rhizoplanae]